jgi:hypothetical protein
VSCVCGVFTDSSDQLFLKSVTKTGE